MYRCTDKYKHIYSPSKIQHPLLPHSWGMGISPYHAKGHMGIYWELGDVQTTPGKVSARQGGIWNVQDVKLKFKNTYYFCAEPTCICVDFCTIRHADIFLFYLYLTLDNRSSNFTSHTTEHARCVVSCTICHQQTDLRPSNKCH